MRKIMGLALWQVFNKSWDLDKGREGGRREGKKRRERGKTEKYRD